MNKKDRLEKIRRFVSDYDIGTQEEIVEHLRESGITATQATVSRDIKELGIVKDKKVHLAVLEKVTAFIMEAGFSVRGLDFSPIQGGQGNVEFLAYLEKSIEPQPLDSAIMTAVVEAAHKEFKDE